MPRRGPSFTELGHELTEQSSGPYSTQYSVSSNSGLICTSICAVRELTAFTAVLPMTGLRETGRAKTLTVFWLLIDAYRVLLSAPDSDTASPATCGSAPLPLGTTQSTSCFSVSYM